MARPAAGCCDTMGLLKKGPWTPDEDRKLFAYVQQHGFGNWRTLPEKAGLQRCGKSCRLRWINYLRPDLKRGKFSLQEEHTIIQLHAFLGNRWSAIAAHLPNRTDNEIKNYWNTRIKKRLNRMGIDPTTHKPRSNLLIGTLNHMAQWESARLEAEARLVKDSKRILSPPSNQKSSSNSNNNNKGSRPRTNKSECLDVLKAWQSVVTGMFAISATNNLDPVIFGSNQSSWGAAEDGSIVGEELIFEDDRSKYTVPKLNNSSSMCLRNSMYHWTGPRTGRYMVEGFSDISVHDFDYPIQIEQNHQDL
ncbi:hypothetical protein V6N13_105287 [Hibiscus sabdariffa]|uniref:Uncharacterized protein n=1 Tax=Hibiscus sabdariffa TaxID=183260 RepID=A0ABR2EXP6_9ROSI